MLDLSGSYTTMKVRSSEPFNCALVNGQPVREDTDIYFWQSDGPTNLDNVLSRAATGDKITQDHPGVDDFVKYLILGDNDRLYISTILMNDENRQQKLNNIVDSGLEWPFVIKDDQNELVLEFKIRIRPPCFIARDPERENTLFSQYYVVGGGL